MGIPPNLYIDVCLENKRERVFHLLLAIPRHTSRGLIRSQSSAYCQLVSVSYHHWPNVVLRFQVLMSPKLVRMIRQKLRRNCHD